MVGFNNDQIATLICCPYFIGYTSNVRCKYRSFLIIGFDYIAYAFRAVVRVAKGLMNIPAIYTTLLLISSTLNLTDRRPDCCSFLYVPADE
jgi:hypothetical protein